MIGIRDIPSKNLGSSSIPLGSAITSSDFEKHQEQWTEMLSKAIYLQSIREVKFKETKFGLNRNELPSAVRKYTHVHSEFQNVDDHLQQMLELNKEIMSSIAQSAHSLEALDLSQVITSKQTSLRKE